MFFTFLIGIISTMTLEIFSIYDAQLERTKVLVVLNRHINNKYSINILGQAYNEQRVLGVFDQITDKDILTDKKLKKYSDLSKYCVFTSLPLDLCNTVSNTVLEFTYEGDLGRFYLDLSTDFVKTSGKMIIKTWWFDICSKYELMIKACCVYKKCSVSNNINICCVYSKGELKKESISLKKEAEVFLCNILSVVREIGFMIENVEGSTFVDERVKEINKKMIFHAKKVAQFYKKYIEFSKKKENDRNKKDAIVTSTRDKHKSTRYDSSCEQEKVKFKKSNMERIVGIEFEYFCVFVISSVCLYLIFTCVEKIENKNLTK
jgi:acetolactate synthase regulatory subunit